MGSAGSGNFGNYRKNNGSENGGIGGLGEVDCPEIIDAIKLEDIAVSEYYENHGTYPPQYTSIRLRSSLLYGRLVVETDDSKEIIGNLPTQYNFLLNCIKKGKRYKGHILSSGDTPIPNIVVTLHA